MQSDLNAVDLFVVVISNDNLANLLILLHLDIKSNRYQDQIKWIVSNWFL